MRRVAVSLLLASALFSGEALAQAPGSTSPQDVAAAEVLFQSAQELFAAGDYRAACSKFAASYDLDPGLGTLLNLARCYEKDGRTASAWAAYVDLAALAARARQADRASIAEERRAALEPELMHLRFVVPAGSEVVIALDGEPVASALHGTPVPVDPGEHQVTAQRRDAAPYFTEAVVVSEAGETIDVTVPEPPEPVAPPEPAPPPPPMPPPVAVPSPEPPPFTPIAPPEDDRSAWWIAGGVTVGLGAVVLGVGAGFTADAASAWSDAGCEGGLCPDAASQRLADRARRSADIATGLGVAGGAVAATGVVLLLVGALVGDEPAVGIGPDGLRLRF